ncbi:MAG: hypothetical protein Q7R43_04015 [Candidatus Daviesbacteria bacterium]|nr:hypothetical protein [Candidatus Daviesbacteria bacterium]
MKILSFRLKIIQDSRGQDTLEAEMKNGDLKSVSSVPAGKSKGKLETTTIEPKAALKKLKTIKQEILGHDFSSILEFDSLLKQLDGTKGKTNLGGNLILVLSMAFTKLFAKSNNLETFELIAKTMGKSPSKFPYLYFNLIGGGLHAKKSLPFQEYLLVTKFVSPLKGLNYAKGLVEKLKNDIRKNFKEVRMGDEGAFAINTDDPKVGLNVLQRNIDDRNVSLALDVAASSFYQNDNYQIGQKILSSDDLLNYYEKLVEEFSLISIEDPFAEDDRAAFIKICKRLKNKIWIIGDDLTVSNPALIKKAKKEKCATGVIIKPNQIGSVSEVLKAVKLAQSYGWKIIVSHRSGETFDDFIADLAYGIGADGLKSGAPTQEQRLVKYNRLIEIERSLNK